MYYGIARFADFLADSVVLPLEIALSGKWLLVLYVVWLLLYAFAFGLAWQRNKTHIPNTFAHSG